MNPKDLPPAVINLKKIWDLKKKEMRFTQVEAAKDLDWTQGAISHYLNGITQLNPAAVIKFANFLGVPAVEIDPNIVEHLPNTQKIRIYGDTTNVSKRVTKNIYIKQNPNTKWLEVDPKTPVYDEDGLHEWKMGDTVIKVSPIKESPNTPYLLVEFKTSKPTGIYHRDTLPAEKNIKKMWGIDAFAFFEGRTIEQ